MNKFWLVYNANRSLNTAKVKHPTEASALAEAERLAAFQPDDTFYVLEAKSASCVQKVVTTQLK